MPACRIAAFLAALIGLSVPALAQFEIPGIGPQMGYHASAVAQRRVVSPGDRIAIAVVIDHAEGWHTWPAAEQDALPPSIADFAINTAISFDTPAWVSAVGSIQWPEPHDGEVADPMGGPKPVNVPLYSGRAIAYVSIEIAADAPVGTEQLVVTLSGQSCNESQCLMPTDDELIVEFEIAAPGTVVETGEADPALFADFDPVVFSNMGAGAGASPGRASAGAAGRTFFGVVTIPPATSVVGIVVVSLLGVLGGFILNLTPCVLPVIPIKVMTISKHAGSPGRTLVLGLWMAAGVIAFWLALGVLAASFASLADPSRIFGIWYVTLAIGLIIGAMGIGTMGVFTFNLPQSVYMVNPKADSAPGSFGFGVMTAVLGLPCFGFVAGALLAGSATLPPGVILVIFASLGVGMALPYLVLSAKPGWVARLPRTGPASDLVKQVMGLLLLAAAVYFIASAVFAYIGGVPRIATTLPWWARQVHWWAIALVALGAGGWLAVRTFQITRRPGPRAVFAVIGVFLGAAPVLYAADSTAKARNDFWVPYTSELFEAAIGTGRVVVLEFTAVWCLNCHAIERAVLLAEPVRSRLTSAGVVPMKVDLSSNAAPGWDKLRELGRTGIPTLAIFGPGLGDDGPIIYNAYTSQMVMDAIDRAAGPTGASAPAGGGGRESAGAAGGGVD